MADKTHGLPPADIGLEDAVIGACFHSAKIARVVAAEPSAIFYLERNREIQRAIAELTPSLNGTPPDLALVKASVGEGIGLEILATLFEAGMLLVDVAPHLKQLRKLAADREEWAAALGIVVARDRECPVDWRTIDEYRARAAAFRADPGTTMSPLLPRLADERAEYLIEKVLLAGETNIIFGDGGEGKSWVALLFAAAVASATSLPGGLRPLTRAPVLLLDYESQRSVQQDRLVRLVAGGLRDPGEHLLYQELCRPLHDEAPRLQAEAKARGVGLVVVDSLAPAMSGAEDPTEATIQVMTEMRGFAPATRLLVCHVSKTTAEQRTGPRRPFGSVFTWNLARSVWEIRRAEEDEGALKVALFHRKSNAGRLLSPIGLSLRFEGDRIILGGFDLGETPDLLAGTSLRFRIEKTLAAGARSVAELCEELGVGQDTVERTLRRLRSRDRVLKFASGAWGLKA